MLISLVGAKVLGGARSVEEDDAERAQGGNAGGNNDDIHFDSIGGSRQRGQFRENNNMAPAARARVSMGGLQASRPILVWQLALEGRWLVM